MTTFYISDTHFGHDACCTKFVREDGSPLRPFSCAQEADEEMIRRWNSVVGPNDKVYHLGDVVMRKQFLSTMDRLNGQKTLIKGNHDIFEAKDYLKYFREIHAIRYPDTRDFVMSHIPLHPESVRERYKFNVHGHLHANRVTRPHQFKKNGREIDPMYLNICVEQTDYTPISHDEVLQRIRDQQD